MKRRSLFVIGLIIGVAGFAVGQRSLTNSDLEKYRQQRLKAEQEYRDNYARWGMPSPEELDRQRELSRAETLELAASLRNDALERERLEAEREASERFMPDYQQPYYREQPGYFYDPGFFWPHGGGSRFSKRQRYSQPGYFAGGQFWPTGPSTPPQPMFRTRRRR